jgi:hypothetical protein
MSLRRAKYQSPLVSVPSAPSVYRIEPCLSHEYSRLATREPDLWSARARRGAFGALSFVSRPTKQRDPTRHPIITSHPTSIAGYTFAPTSPLTLTAIGLDHRRHPIKHIPSLCPLPPSPYALSHRPEKSAKTPSICENRAASSSTFLSHRLSKPPL